MASLVFERKPSIDIETSKLCPKATMLSNSFGLLVMAYAYLYHTDRLCNFGFPSPEYPESETHLVYLCRFFRLPYQNRYCFLRG